MTEPSHETTALDVASPFAGPSKDGLQTLLIALIATVLTLLALAPLAYVAYRHQPPQIVTVDLQKLLEDQQQKTIDLLKKGGGHSDEQHLAAEKLTIDFAKALSTAVDTLGQDCRCVIVNKAAILGGAALDYTELVREKLR